MKTKTYYLVGIGGIGMSAIARYLKEEGNYVFGYDRVCTELTRELEREGMWIVYEDDSSHIANLNVDEVIYTPAIPSDSAILRYIREKGIPIFKRSEALGRITRGKKTIAVAGTHGKTTTAGLIAHILKNSHVGCSAFLGGISNNYSTNFLINHKSDYVVVEADEYDSSFLSSALGVKRTRRFLISLELTSSAFSCPTELKESLNIPNLFSLMRLELFRYCGILSKKLSITATISAGVSVQDLEIFLANALTSISSPYSADA